MTQIGRREESNDRKLSVTLTGVNRLYFNSVFCKSELQQYGVCGQMSAFYGPNTDRQRKLLQTGQNDRCSVLKSAK